jgi:hypothetical protein
VIFSFLSLCFFQRCAELALVGQAFWNSVGFSTASPVPHPNRWALEGRIDR